MKHLLPSGITFSSAYIHILVYSPFTDSRMHRNFVWHIHEALLSTRYCSYLLFITKEQQLTLYFAYYVSRVTYTKFISKPWRIPLFRKKKTKHCNSTCHVKIDVHGGKGFGTKEWLALFWKLIWRLHGEFFFFFFLLVLKMGAFSGSKQKNKGVFEEQHVV